MELQKLTEINSFKDHILEQISHNLITPLIPLKS